jgi:hypothetical protein
VPDTGALLRRGLRLPALPQPSKGLDTRFFFPSPCRSRSNKFFLALTEIVAETLRLRISSQNSIQVDFRERHEIPRHEITKVYALQFFSVLFFAGSSSVFCCMPSSSVSTLELL